jgi:nicotinamidase-related amidase
MPTALADQIDPSTTAVITMELQRGVCGDRASLAALADAVTATGMIPATAAVLAAARRAGALVVHCTFSMLPDRAGTPLNTPMMAMLAKQADYMVHGTESVEVIPALGPEPGDLESNRHHGLSPFAGTDLHSILQRRGVTTIVVTGVSLNVGIPGTVIEAVNNGYRVVLARDCVVGLPTDYGEAIIANTIKTMATIASSADLIAAWIS